MLTPDYLEHVSDKIVELYSELEYKIIKDITRRIGDVSAMTGSAKHQIEVLQKMGLLYDDIIKEISQITGISERIVKSMFEQSAVKTFEYDENVYKKANLNPISFNQSPSMLNLLITNINNTNNTLYNLTKTTASTSQQSFIKACDIAYSQIQSGAFDYNTAIFNAVKEVTSKGITVEYDTGYTSKLDVAVRRNIVTSINQTSGQLQDMRAEELGLDIVETTAHAGARPTHALWQGKWFSKSGNSKEYPSLVEVTKFGTATGLMGINCRHTYHYVIPGVSNHAYSDKYLEDINNETVRYNGKDIKRYEATQMQRAIEREIRQNKRDLAGNAGILSSNAKESAIKVAKEKFFETSSILKKNEKQLKDFIEQTSLTRQEARERVPTFDKHLSNATINVNKTLENTVKGLYNIDSSITNQLGFLEDNKYNFIPKDTIISNATPIAGTGTNSTFRNATKYAEKYGGLKTDYYKMAGKVVSDKYVFDIHWVQSKYGKYDYKIKNRSVKK